MKQRQHPEQDMQRALARYLDLCGYCWCHVANEGGNRKPYEGAILKGLGVKAGVPDVLIFDPPAIEAEDGQPAIGVAVELKARKGDKPTDSQHLWRSLLIDRHWVHKFCYSFDEAVAFVEECYPTRNVRRV